MNVKKSYRIVLTEKSTGDIILDTDQELTAGELKNYAEAIYKNHKDRISWTSTDYEIEDIYDMTCIQEGEL